MKTNEEQTTFMGKRIKCKMHRSRHYKPRFKEDKTENGLLLGYYIDDFIPEDHIARVVDEIVEQLDTEEIERNYSSLGQRSYHPKILIKIIFYGYTIGVCSSRKIGQGCQQDMAFMYLARLYQPDFRTISEFRKKYLRELGGYFVDILRYCNELGLLNAGVISIDGSKFRANASSKRTKNIEGYERWEKRLREEMKKYNEEGIMLDEEENRRLGRGSRKDTIPKEIQRREKLIKKIQEAKEVLKEIKNSSIEDSKKNQKEPKINLTDKDAKFQKERSGVIRANYNAQIAVTKEQLIVASDITTEANDRKQLIPMIEESEKNTGQKVREAKADAGYSGVENFKELSERGINGYVPNQNFNEIRKSKNQEKESKYQKNNFIYKTEKDCYICPEGQELKYCGTTHYTYRTPMRRYKSESCRNCKARKECARSKIRTVTRLEGEEYINAMRDKLKTPEGIDKYKERMYLVEPPFGHFKKNLGFLQFLLRGLEKVREEFRLLCIGYNIKKIHKLKLQYI